MVNGVRKILVSCFGRVRKQEFEVPPGRLLVLRGQNGTGKTTMLNTIEHGLSKDPKSKISITPTDGQSRGRAEIFGATISLTEKRSAKTGEPSVKGVCGGKILATIVDPQIKDPVIADEERAKALSQLFGIQGEPDVMAEKTKLAADEIEEFFGDPGDLLPWANAGRKRLNDEALNAEKESVKAQARKDAADGQAKELKAAGAEGDPKEAQAELERHIAAKAAAETRAKARKELEELTAVRPTVEVFEDLETISLNIEVSDNEIAKMREQIKKIEEGIAAREKIKSADQATQKELNGELKRAQRRDEILADKETLTPEDAQKAIDEQRTKVAAAARVADLERSVKKAEAAASDVKTFNERAEAFRKAAEAVDSAITEIVSQNIGFFIFEKGRILVDTEDRGKIPFAALSPGQRWTPVIGSAAKLAGAGAVITIPQEAYEGLDPLNREVVKAALAEYDVSAVTAECSADGEIVVVCLN